MIIFWSSFTFSNWVGFIFLISIYGIMYVFLSNFSRDGQDLNAKGMIEYMKDLIYIGWIIQVLTCLSDWFWLIYLGVPIYAAYKFYGLYNSASAYQDLYSPQETQQNTRNNKK
jgi:hypothetical protein